MLEDQNKAGSSPLARIAIDRGGTFTDVICSRAGHEDIVFKVSWAVWSLAYTAAISNFSVNHTALNMVTLIHPAPLCRSAELRRCT